MKTTTQIVGQLLRTFARLLAVPFVGVSRGIGRYRYVRSVHRRRR